MEVLIPTIIAWAEERNLIRGSSTQTLALHLTAEFGQLSDALITGEDCRKYIGNTLVELIILCHKECLTLYECIELVTPLNDERAKDPIFTLIGLSKYLGQLSSDILHNKNFKLNIGYICMYLTILSRNTHSPIKECLSLSFNDLKMKKGILFDGSFILETDEYYAHAVQIVNGRKNQRT